MQTTNLYEYRLLQLIVIWSCLKSTATAFAPLTTTTRGQNCRGFVFPVPPPQSLQVSPTTLPEGTEILSRAIRERPRNESESIIGALRALELDERQRVKNDPTVANNLRDNLPGDWQLIFVTDKRLQSIIYLPVDNVLTIRDIVFDTDNEIDLLQVENAICVGPDRWNVLSFIGTMEWEGRKRQGFFDYNRFTAFNRGIDVTLKPGQAESLVRTVEKREQSSTRPFFQFFLANDEMAAARGSVGGFALWKRVTG